MVGQPKRDLGDLRRKLFDFNSEKLVDVHFQRRRYVEKTLAVGVDFLQHVDFQEAQLSVRDDEEIAATARRVEKFQGRQLRLELS